MAVKQAILGLLKKRDSYGYELQQRFDDLAGSYWPVKKPQFYTTLERLEQKGLVDKKSVRQEKRPDKKVYSLTKGGEKEFTEWLMTPSKSPRTLKDEFFLKASFALEESLTIAENLFRNQRQSLLNLLHQLHKVLDSAKQSNNQRLYLLAKGAILHGEADLKWLEEFEAQLERPSEKYGGDS